MQLSVELHKERARRKRERGAICLSLQECAEIHFIHQTQMGGVCTQKDPLRQHAYLNVFFYVANTAAKESGDTEVFNYRSTQGK